jgi:hypothetical protein
MAYTTIDDPSQYFQTDIHTGDGSGSTETFDGNSNLQPDFLWFKSRSVTGDHGWVDTSRSKPSSNNSFFILRSNSTGGDVTVNSGSDFTAMNSDGYTYGSVHYLDLATNNSQNAVWGWKANGGTTSSNSSGSITSTVQANTTAGFSIVTYTGTGSSATVGHGLGAVPHWIIVKRRDSSSSWIVYHHKNTSAPETDILELQATNATFDSSTYFNDTAPTSSVFTVNTSSDVNASSGNYVAYVFTEIQGYSKFGSYKGNGNADGTFIYTGFKPAFILGKNTSSAGNHWFINDNQRGINGGANWIKADSNAAELTNLTNPDFLSNGFKMRNNNAIFNENNSTFVYLAFAEHPFVSSGGVPITAK